jgi:hypothetical protein
MIAGIIISISGLIVVFSSEGEPDAPDIVAYLMMLVIALASGEFGFIGTYEASLGDGLLAYVISPWSSFGLFFAVGLLFDYWLFKRYYGL